MTMTRQEFMNNFKEQYNYVYELKDLSCMDSLQEGLRNYIIEAPVKSGKRYMIIGSSLIQPDYIHYSISALHRRADDEQRRQLNSYNIKHYSINNKKSQEIFLEIINNINDYQKTIVHLDELDYGAGQKQLLSPIIEKIAFNKNIELRLYSASPYIALEEYGVSKDTFYKLDKFEPNEAYYGIENYLLDNRIKSADEFYTLDDHDDIVLSNQAREILKNLIEAPNDKYIGILRLSGKIRLNNKKKSESQFEYFKKHFHETFKDEKTGKKIIFRYSGTNDSSIDWSNPNIWKEDFNRHEYKYVIVINQTCGRSTEWTCHQYCCWYHCRRSPDSTISTCLQDQERIVYYKNPNLHINLIIYGDIYVAEVSAGRVEKPDSNERKIDGRIQYKKGSSKPRIKEPICTSYKTWQEIPEHIRKNKKENTHLKHTIKTIIETIPNEKQQENNSKKLNKFIHHFVDNVRSSRNSFIKQAKNCLTNPVIFESYLRANRYEGLNENHPIRINLFYPDNEIDPTKYQFMVREFNGLVESDLHKDKNYINKSTYI